MTDSVERFDVRERTTGELLSLVAGRTVKEIPDLSALSRMTTAEMADRLGIDRKGAQTIQAALELAHRSKTLGRNRVQFPDASAISAWFRERLGEHRKESFWALTLDQKHKVIDCHRISEGSLTMTVVHPREARRLSEFRFFSSCPVLVHNIPRAASVRDKTDTYPSVHESRSTSDGGLEAFVLPTPASCPPREKSASLIQSVFRIHPSARFSDLNVSCRLFMASSASWAGPRPDIRHRDFPHTRRTDRPEAKAQLSGPVAPERPEPKRFLAPMRE